MSDDELEMFNTSLVPCISVIMTQKEPKHVGDNGTSQWESYWNMACFRTLHMINIDPTISVVANSYEGFLLHMFGTPQSAVK